MLIFTSAFICICIELLTSNSSLRYNLCGDGCGLLLGGCSVVVGGWCGVVMWCSVVVVGRVQCDGGWWDGCSVSGGRCGVGWVHCGGVV